MTSKEALEMLKSCGTNTEEPYESRIIEALEKLVERDTPKKVKRSANPTLIIAFCPKCRHMVDIGYNGCPYCLQRLDWSE